MAKKPANKTPDGVVLEGDREPGEATPLDDSHVMEQVPDIGDGDAPDDAPKPTDPPPTEPKMYNVSIGGQTMMVAEDVYDAIMAERAEVAASRNPDPTPPPRVEEEGDDYTDLLFSDPNALVEKITERVTAEVSSKLGNAYRADQAQKDFWSSFYTENKDLREEDGIVKMVLAKNWDMLKSLPGKRGRDKLAELTEAEILRIVNKRGAPPPGRHVPLEGDSPSAPGRAPVASAAEPTGKVLTLGDALRERRKARDRANRQLA